MSNASQDKPLRYRELRSKLKIFGVTEHRDRGKGSNGGLYHPNINGKPVWYDIKCHGEGNELSKAVVRAARERFNISLEEFY